MSGREHLSWRVPERVWERFESYTVEKHGTRDPYLRFELESAMREFLDYDEILAEAEELLRTHTDLQGLSSSTSTVATGQYRNVDTEKVQHRVSSDLKEQFAIFADEHEADSYGRLLASALDAYVDGGRERRILDDVERLVTGRQPGTSEDLVESGGSDELSTSPEAGSTPESAAEAARSTSADGGSTAPGVVPDVEDADLSTVEIEARDVLAATDALADTFESGMAPRQLVEETIRDVTDVEDGVEVAALREQVLDQFNAGEHPHREGVYVTETRRENARLYADMDGAECRAAVPGFLATDLVAHREKLQRAYDYKEVQEVFRDNAGGGAPSDQFAFDLMRHAGELPGFDFGKYHGQKQLRVNLDEVSDDVLAFVVENTTMDDPLARVDLDGRLEDYSVGSPPEQEAAADD